MAIIRIYGYISIFYSFLINTILNLSGEKWILVYPDQYSARKTSKDVYDKDKHHL